MKSFVKRAYAAPIVLLSGLLLAPLASAEVGTGLTTTFGPEKYHAYDLMAYADLPGLPLGFEARGFVAKSDSTEVLNAVEWRLNWTPTSWFQASYAQKTAQAEIFDLRTKGLSLSGNLAALWDSPSATLLTVGYTDVNYEINGPRIVRNALDPLLPGMHQYTLGLAQDIGEAFTIGLTYDDFRYSEDPTILARQLLRRLRRPNNGIFELLSFPDRTTTIDLTWRTTQRLTLDGSVYQTHTVTDQKLEGARLGASYRLGELHRIGVAVSRASSEAVTRNGVRLVDGTGANYLEVSARIAFD